MRLVLKGLKQIALLDDGWTPVPAGKDDVLVDVICCAVCRTDAKMWDQGHRDLVFPRILGHEMVVRDAQGKRWAVWPGNACGACRYCLTDRENLCEKMKITGFHHDGGFADQAVLLKKSLIEIPDLLSSHAACFAEPAACVINAFEPLDVQPGSRLLVFGAGTMGLLTAFYASCQKMDVTLVEKSQLKIDRVRSFCQTHGLALVKETRESEYDLAITCCPDPMAFCQATIKTRKGGQFSFFSGLAKNQEIETNLINQIHYKEMEIRGVYGMTRSHMKKAIAFIAAHPMVIQELIQEVCPLQQVPEIMPRVLAGSHLKFILDVSLTRGWHEKPPSPDNLSHSPPDTISAETLKDPAGANVIRTVAAIPVLSKKRLAAATAKMDEKTKPLGALGRLEDVAVQMSCIQDTLFPKIEQKHLFVFAADHGITEEGVSAFPADVTAQMVDNFLNGGAAINVLCRHHDIRLKVVDMGVNHVFRPHPDLVAQKVAFGTQNFAISDAMTADQVMQALEGGIAAFRQAHDRNPIDIVGLGEMGIGNTTAATAIICAVTGISPQAATGRGTGVDDKGLAHKTKVIQKVLDFHNPPGNDGYIILQKIGGFEIAGIAGAILAAAKEKTAIMLDGVISTAAGLVAAQINPDVISYMISGHRSAEVAHQSALDHLGLTPLVDLSMRLGEGTGAALAIDMVDAACRIMCEMASFEEAKVAGKL